MTADSQVGSYFSTINFLIPQSPPGNIPPEQQAALKQIYISLQQIVYALVNNCGISSQDPNKWGQLEATFSGLQHSNLGRMYLRATEDILESALISMCNDGNGKLAVRNANATNNSRVCDGYCSTAGGISAGKVGEVIIGPGLIKINGAVIGTRYFLSTTNGAPTPTRPAATGNIQQYIGVGVASNILYVNPGHFQQL